MTITDSQAVELASPEVLRWNEDRHARGMGTEFPRIASDESHEAHSITWNESPIESSAVLPHLRATLNGREPHDIEAISYELTDNVGSPTASAKAIDICLWDLVGKMPGLPVFTLLGAARDRLRAYTITHMCDTIHKHVNLAVFCREIGLTARKLHAFAVPDRDTEECGAVRQAVGHSMNLMVDPVDACERRGALRVARVLEELEFYCIKTPRLDSDLPDLEALSRSLDIPIVVAESVRPRLNPYPPQLVNHAGDMLREAGDVIDGITVTRKAAALCEACGVKYKLHGHACMPVCAEHFQVTLAKHNCDFAELLVRQELLQLGMGDVMRKSSDEFFDAPNKPRLGHDEDRDAIDYLTVRAL